MEQQFQFFDDTENELDNSLDEEGESELENENDGERTLKVRLDKWLWAARFFKTRALARAAVEAGKVFYNGERSKPSREIEVEALLQIRQGRFEKTVIVKGLSTRRRSTEEALQLFEETESSKSSREFHREFNEFKDGTDHYASRNPCAPQEAQRRTTRFLRRSFNRQTQGRADNIRDEFQQQEHHHQPNYSRSDMKNDYNYPQSRYPNAEYPRSEYPRPEYSRKENSRVDYPRTDYPHTSRSNYQQRGDYSQQTYKRSDYSRGNYPSSGYSRNNHHRQDSQQKDYSQSYQARSAEYYRSDYSRNERYEAPQYNYNRSNQPHYKQNLNQKMEGLPNTEEDDLEFLDNEE